ncbi:MAG: hypothetical protein QOJ33_1346, partial [Chloroflexota bacterium]|nr:hypothetical protein [Chloroflexota bacterium]
MQGGVAVQKANGRSLGVRRTRSLGSREASLGHPTITRLSRCLLSTQAMAEITAECGNYEM